jgi:hypothetical protein
LRAYADLRLKRAQQKPDETINYNVHLASLLQLGLSQAELSAQQRSAGPNSATFPAPVDSLYSRANANPWFSDLEVRRGLRLNNEQYRLLNDGYRQSWQAY